MDLETKIKYSFVILEEYKDLKNGRPNRHHNKTVNVSGEGDVSQFLKSVVANSKIAGLSIININFEIID